MKRGILLMALCLWASVAEAPAQVLFRWGRADDPTECDFSRFHDKAGNVIERGVPAKSGQCSARTGAGTPNFGKLMVHLVDSAGVQRSYSELWMRGWVYFHPDYPVPCCGDVLISPHLWRFHEPNWRFFRDFSTVQGQDRTRDFYFGSGLGVNVVRYHSDFHFASADRRGRWQCWEIRTRLNTPGQSDGISEFYADGVLIGRHQGLNLRGDTTYGYGKVDVQSNIAKPADARVPPEMWWLVDDIVISTARVGCGDAPAEPEPGPEPEPAPPPAVEDPLPAPDPAPEPEPPLEQRVAQLEAEVAALKEKLVEDAEARRQIADLRAAFQAVLARLRAALQP